MAHDDWAQRPEGTAGGQTWPPAGPPTGPQTAGQAGKRAAPWAVAAAPRPVAPPPRAPVSGAGMVPAPAVPPPAGPTVVPVYPSQAKGGGGRRVLAALAVLLLVGAGAGVTWFLMRDDAPETSAAPSTYGAPLTSSPADDDEGSSDSSPSSAPTTTDAAPSTSETPTPTAMTEADALAELQSLRSASLSRLVLDDRWVAQVASKSVGITDPLQVAANGTHTFYAVDILIESQAALGTVADPYDVYVVQSTDFGKRSFAPDGQAFWVTLVDAGFGSSDQVQAWCARTYPMMTAEELANACAPRTLAQPHD